MIFKTESLTKFLKCDDLFCYFCQFCAKFCVLKAIIVGANLHTSFNVKCANLIDMDFIVLPSLPILNMPCQCCLYQTRIGFLPYIVALSLAGHQKVGWRLIKVEYNSIYK